MHEPEILRRRREHLILRVDRADLSKNVLRGFTAFDIFLEQHPEFREQVTFIAHLQPSRQDVPEYVEYLEKIEALVAVINHRHGTTDWMPIDLRLRDDFEEAVALYKHFDLLLVNAMWDGMNLVSKEGPLVNTRDGMMILSENTGAHEELGDCALSVNPFDVQEQADAMYRALTATPEERERRMRLLRHIIESRTPADWIDDQLADIEEKARQSSAPVAETVAAHLGAELAACDGRRSAARRRAGRGGAGAARRGACDAGSSSRVSARACAGPPVPAAARRRRAARAWHRRRGRRAHRRGGDTPTSGGQRRRDRSGPRGAPHAPARRSPAAKRRRGRRCPTGSGPVSGRRSTPLAKPRTAAVVAAIVGRRSMAAQPKLRPVGAARPGGPRGAPGASCIEQIREPDPVRRRARSRATPTGACAGWPTRSTTAARPSTTCSSSRPPPTC